MKFQWKVIGAVLISGVWAAGQAAVPARTMADIHKDFAVDSKELSAVMPPTRELLDPAKCAEAAPKALPVFKKLEALFREAAAIDPTQKEEMDDNQNQVLSMEMILGDKGAEESLARIASGPDAKNAMSAKTAMLSAQWIKSAKDPAAQGKVLDESEALAKANPSDEAVAELIEGCVMLGPASKDLKDRATKIAMDVLKGPKADQIHEEIASMQKLATMESKPLVLSGVTLDGKTLSTEGWKGKVILVDFWATWCAPCREELPRVEKAYAGYHDKGLEVLGVSCDESGEDLNKFLAENKAMAWPQLFDPKAPGWHPLATKLEIKSIPTMFLIDKKGILRSTDGVDSLETEIPKLLAE